VPLRQEIGAFYTLVPIRPRSRGERRSLRTLLPGVSLRPPLAFNPDTPLRLSTPLLTRFNSTPTFARTERPSDRLNVVIGLTRKTLANLRLAIAGTVALAGDLVDAMDALFDANVPRKWLAKSWESATIGTWFQGLLQRYDQLRKWLNDGRPKGYWMTGFFNPGGFLTAMKQEVSRQHAKDKWALDDVVMESRVTAPPKEIKEIKEEPKEGVYIYGLYLEGCSWDGKMNRLVDSDPKKLFVALPVLYVTGVLAKDKETQNVFSCPTYKIKKRTGLNFIAQFDLRTEDPVTKWILRGVCLLCSVD